MENTNSSLDSNNSLPIQNTEPMQNTEISKKNLPFSDGQVIGVTMLFGPLAGGILVFHSLKRLGSNHKWYPILVSIVLTIIVSYVAMFLIHEEGMKLSKIPIQLGMGLILILFQYELVKQWKQSNPQAKYGGFLEALGFGILGMVGYLAIVFLIALIFTP